MFTTGENIIGMKRKANTQVFVFFFGKMLRFSAFFKKNKEKITSF
jgi:hypothetical protein